MSKVSYFQRYSQRENHATNNTLLMLRHIYQSSPRKLESVLNALLDSTVAIGVTFAQQVRGEQSVPDAVISQIPIRVYIEAKLGKSLWGEQIANHVASIELARKERGERIGEDILLGLTTEQISEGETKELERNAAAHGVIFKSVTYTQIADQVRAACADYEQELIGIVDDYRDYLGSEGLLDDRSRWLVVFACGTSYEENKRFALYYDHPARPCRRYRFLGCYRNKAVSLVGEIRTILICAYEGGRVKVLEREFGKESDQQLRRIRDVIDETSYYDLKSEPTRFYLVDEFYDTELIKSSPMGIRAMRYIDLESYGLPKSRTDEMSARDLAESLRGKNFE